MRMSDTEAITRSTLFDDLAEAGAGQLTVITPNRRLALDLKRTFDARQIAAGKRAWSSADILPYSAFVERAWLESIPTATASQLLKPAQEFALWERVIADAPGGALLLNHAAAARQVRDAWGIMQEFRIDLAQHRGELDQDSAAFREWAKRYAARCEAGQWLDSAMLPDALRQVIAAGNGPVPRTLIRCEFDQLSPQQRELFAAFVVAGSAVRDAAGPQHAAHVTRQIYPDAERELRDVAVQARALAATQPRSRIGVVVPDLAARRAAVIRIFDDVFEPARLLESRTESERPYNVSAGLPLNEYPVIHASLLVLRLVRGELTLQEAGSLLRSPYTAGATEEQAARARADAVLRSRRRNEVKLGSLLNLAAEPTAGLPRWAAALGKWVPQARELRRKRQLPSAWSKSFLDLLRDIGWPGERALDSAEFQTVERFRATVAGLTLLDAVTGAIDLDAALMLLSRSVADTEFQPESVDSPVQVLGVLEAAGLEFDALFVIGLSDEEWPAPPRPNPFLPVVAQRAAQVPRASAEWMLGFAQRSLRDWLTAAPQVILTHPDRDGDRQLQPSPLIVDQPLDSSLVDGIPRLDMTIFAARAREPLDDFCGPALPPGALVHGGSQVFRNQAACPFRAFATHRLGARALDAGHDGLDALERGSLVHEAAANVMRALGSHEQLLNLDAEQQHAIIATGVAEAIEHQRRNRPDVMSDAFARLEATRVEALLLRLLALEATRAPYSVVATERAESIHLVGLDLRGRLDRIDQTAAGQLIIDYKTGVAHTASWLDDRPDEPQLPLYAVAAGNSAGTGVSGIAFVELNAREVRYKGFVSNAAAVQGADAAAWKGVTTVVDWPAQIAQWRTVLEALAHEFMAGRADVAPKRYPQTCQYCDLGAVCRVRELLDADAAADDAEDAEVADD